MSTKYKATELDRGYFITITTVGWIDVFTRLSDSADLQSLLSVCLHLVLCPKKVFVVNSTARNEVNKVLFERSEFSLFRFEDSNIKKVSSD